MAAANKLLDATNEALTGIGGIPGLMGHVHQNLSARRRYLLYSALPYDLRPMCADRSIKPTDKLFGDDLDKAMKQARGTQRET